MKVIIARDPQNLIKRYASALCPEEPTIYGKIRPMTSASPEYLTRVTPDARILWAQGAQINHPEWTQTEVDEFIRRREVLLNSLTESQYREIVDAQSASLDKELAQHRQGEITREELIDQLEQVAYEPLALRLFGIDASQLWFSSNLNAKP